MKILLAGSNISIKITNEPPDNDYNTIIM